jgi:soluble lytic murein transglycosylase
MKKTLVTMIAAAVLVAFVSTPRADEPQAGTVLLQPTNHPKVSRELQNLWLVPDKGRSSMPPLSSYELARAARMQAAGEYTKSLALLSGTAVRQGPLSAYAEYYIAEAFLKLGRTDEAKKAFQTLEQNQPAGYLTLASAIGEAESDELLDDYAGAVAIYSRLLDSKVAAPDDLWMRVGKAAKAGGDTRKALEAFAHVYYEFALSDRAAAAGAELQHLNSISDEFHLELGRAERLFGAKQYGPARAAFEQLAPNALGDDGELIRIRLAECDFYQKRARNARDGLRPYIDHASRQGEALYFYALASYDAGDRAEYLKSIRRVADEFPGQSWAEDALDNLAGYYANQNDDQQADNVFRELYAKYPRGSHGERAAWKIGWRAYRARRYAETVRYFEQAAHDFPRSDYRPPWLYWSGRAHEGLNERALAEERYKLAAADYVNTYHGRLAVERLNGWTPAPRVILASAPVDRPGDGAPVLPPMPPNAQAVRDLLAGDMFDQALSELQYAARVWGDSPQIQATTAWIERQQGRSETGSKQFDLFRGSITLTKRAYPQFMAAGGEQLPRDILAMIYPVAYWDLIRKYSTVNHLDPYLMVALIAQESTFVPDIKSYASAVGLTQLMAPTARDVAKELKIPYSTKVLTNPELNIRVGTTYLSDLIRQFGDAYLALAAYNAGPTRAKRWVAERPGVEREEFIDDIPDPQTQNYVKKLLSTAEDYRRLYGPSAPRGNEPDLDAKLAPATPPALAAPKTTNANAVKPTPAKPSTARKPSTAKSRAR